MSNPKKNKVSALNGFMVVVAENGERDYININHINSWFFKKDRLTVYVDGRGETNTYFYEGREFSKLVLNFLNKIKLE